MDDSEPERSAGEVSVTWKCGFFGHPSTEGLLQNDNLRTPAHKFRTTERPWGSYTLLGNVIQEPATMKPAASPEKRPLCDICQTPMVGIHCKLRCPNCGYTRDCSHP